MLILIPTPSTPSTLTTIQSALTAPINLPHQLPSWSLEIKVFKSNDTNTQPTDDSKKGKFLYKVSTNTSTNAPGSINTGKISALIVNGKSYLTGSPRASSSEVPNPNGSILDLSNGVPESFDSIIQSKLQNQYTLKQTLSGDNGINYEVYLRGRNTRIKAINVFLQGGFRGVFIAVEIIGANDTNRDLLVQELKNSCGLTGDVKCFEGDLFEEVVVRSLGLE